MALPTPGVTPANWGAQLNAEISAKVTQLTGTGSPEGAVAADVGTEYLDTASTTGATRWLKISGTGNTGWRVTFGDTGERNVASLLAVDWSVRGSIRLKRINAQVTLNIQSITGPASAVSSAVALNLPVGFRPTSDTPELTAAQIAGGPVTFWIAAATTLGDVQWTAFGGAAQIDYSYASLSFTTGDAWPTTLPGIAA